MTSANLLLPMAAMVLYISALALVNFFTRFGAYRRGETDGRYFRTFSEGTVSQRVLVVGRHYDHQFQLPMLFLITGCAALALGHVTVLHVACGWAFVIARLVHGAIHLGGNHPLKRAGAFSLGWAVIVTMWVDLVAAVL